MTCTATRHDTLDAYSNHGCRCPEARRAKTLDNKQYRLRRMRGQELFTDATGTVRRLQALQAIGWRNQDLAARLRGIRNEALTSSAIAKLAKQEVVHVKTAAAVAALYDDLWDQPGPSAILRARAERWGWPTPLELDDDLIHDPTYEPQLHRLTPRVERLQRRQQALRTVQELTARGVSSHEIARHIGATSRSVQRYRKQLRDAS